VSDTSRLERDVTPILRDLDERVGASTEGNLRYLLGEFTFADVAMACALGAIRPTDREPFVAKLGPAAKAAWHREEVARAFPRVLAWRDRLYAAHRKAEK
jgi:glutathione S-transferase